MKVYVLYEFYYIVIRFYDWVCLGVLQIRLTTVTLAIQARLIALGNKYFF